MLSNAQTDIIFNLRDVDTVPIGKDFRVVVDIENSCNEVKIYISSRLNLRRCKQTLIHLPILSNIIWVQNA